MTPESELLLQVLRQPRANAPHAPAPALLPTPPDVDWQALFRLAVQHAVLPLAAARLTPAMPNAMPVSEHEWLQMSAIQHQATALAATGELLEVIDALHAAGVAPMPFKGPALAHLLYGDVAMRQYGDLDVLVPDADVARARAALVQAGYRSRIATPLRAATLQRYAHCEALYRNGSTVELHWRVSGPQHASDLDLNAIWARAQSVTFLGHDVIQPLRSDQMLLLCVHGARHAWERLGWICDVAALCADMQPGDWSTLLAEARHQRCSRSVAWGVLLARRLLAAPVPESARRDMGRDHAVVRLVERAAARLFAAPVSVLRRNLLAARAADCWQARISALANSLVTVGPRDWDTVPLPDRLHWLYHGVRPLRLLTQHVLPGARSRP